jgi:hypothetical protein
MKGMRLRERYETKCRGMRRSGKDSLKRAVKVVIEVHQNRKTNPTSIDSVVSCSHISEDKKCTASIDDVDGKYNGNARCKNYVSCKGPIESDFTFADLNDRPKPCPEKQCSGLVLPTWNANVGSCYKCQTRVNWNSYARR